MPLLVAPFALIVALLLVAFLSFSEEKDNAEFEAKNCPEMLQVDSKYCKKTDN
ncbi:hypothetical protein [Psychrobacter aestuarii]|uniref:Uncharacterized protein n=1 Tax=Psychrobacter aestuarii TaxID=556327 RepID=A0ABN0W4N1_9GAMM|nr:hypothetical protein [Psychrobacter aestuarii]